MPTLLDRLGRWNLGRLGARSSFVEVDGARVHVYEVAGRGARPLALLHGVGSSAAPFAPLVKRLRPHFSRIVLPEAPAHGYSPAPAGPMDTDALFRFVAGALDAALPDGGAVYGNSLGGGTAVRYAVERPQRVDQLLLLSPAGARTAAGPLQELLAGFRLDTLAEARAFMARLFHRPRWWARLAARDLRRRLHHPVVRQLLDGVTVEDQLDPADVAALAMPVLFMWGEAERVLPPSHLAWYRAHLPPGARLVHPPHFAHSAYIEFPDEVAREIIDFTRSASPDSDDEVDTP